MSDVFIGLGGNLGDREALLAEALRKLDATPGIKVAAVSSLYETKPVGITAQPDFLNLVVKLETNLPPYALLNTCLRIETELGRERRERWGPRTVDVDVVSVDGVTSDAPELLLPHPGAFERATVLIPWLDVEPDAVLPGHGPVAALPFSSEGVRRRDDLVLASGWMDS